MSGPFTVAAIGCSGPVAQHFVQGFIDQRVALRILARRPEEVRERCPRANIMDGSMMDAGDVARVAKGVDAVFLVTPMGFNNDPASEIEAARRVIAGLQSAGSPHVIYTSCLGVECKQGVGILGAKHAMEKLIGQSGIPHSILRCGTYMGDLFAPRVDLLRKGKFLFPLCKDRRFTFTSQADVPRFVVHELLGRESDLCEVGRRTESARY